MTFCVCRQSLLLLLVTVAEGCFCVIIQRVSSQHLTMIIYKHISVHFSILFCQLVLYCFLLYFVYVLHTLYLQFVGCIWWFLNGTLVVLVWQTTIYYLVIYKLVLFKYNKQFTNQKVD